ncbi:threonine/serine exporter family protein [Cellulomonas sp. JZ18]|uniref:threonine/serine ThrE exporter family protein n=1 Tax=Cellulomonas sp. JZ18 TaxID=2654191 RepID=UPI0012D41FCD|nr:threonine/serine exporter family protein [Cellulomonas sp. JZ18]QGQ18985.1 threonine/serine exporter family protein [Cellulomonas sp. JZ18]
MRAVGVVRRLARRGVGGPPTVQVGRRTRGGGRDEAFVRDVLELAVRVGETMLSLGASAADVTATIRRLAHAFGLECEVDLTFTAILVSHDPGGSRAPVTVLRVVAARTADYGRLTRVLELAQEVGAGPDGPEDHAAVVARLRDAHERLDVIVAAPHPYHRRLVTVLLSVMAAGVAVLLGGGLAVAVLAGATTAVVDRVLLRLQRWAIPPFFQQAAGATVATLVAVALFVLVPLLPVGLATLPPALVVASGIVVLLAGLSFVGAAEDAIDGFPVTAVGRMFEVLLLTLGIVVGIGGVLDVAQRLGVTLEVVDVPQGALPTGVQAVAAGVVSGAWALASYARARAAVVAALAGGTAWLTSAALGALGLGPAVAGAGAALLVGFLAESLARRLRVPAIVTSICAIVPLLPGLAIYRGLFRLVQADPARPATPVLLGAAMVALGLAAGVTLGGLLARPLRERVRRATWPVQRVGVQVVRRPGRGDGTRTAGGPVQAAPDPGDVRHTADAAAPDDDAGA